MSFLRWLCDCGAEFLKSSVSVLGTRMNPAQCSRMWQPIKDRVLWDYKLGKQYLLVGTTKPSISETILFWELLRNCAGASSSTTMIGVCLSVWGGVCLRLFARLSRGRPFSFQLCCYRFFIHREKSSFRSYYTFNESLMKRICLQCDSLLRRGFPPGSSF